MMNIKPVNDVTKCPKTRRELLYHLWGVGLTNVNVFREGSYYAITVGRIISATHLKRIGTLTYEQWEKLAKDVPKSII
jgi:hypothetical protein